MLKTSVSGGVITTYVYDNEQRLVSKTVGGVTTTYAYDNFGNLITETTGEDVVSYTYSDDSKKTLKSVTKDGCKTTVKTDVYGRQVAKELTSLPTFKIDEEKIKYLKKGDHTTNLPTSIEFLDKYNSRFKDSLRYFYDSRGNISQINENGKLLVRYSYDGLNRLIREDNKKFSKTYLFDYDGTGNILSKKTRSFTLDNTEQLYSFTSEDNYYYTGDLLTHKNSLICTYNNKGVPVGPN